MWRGLAMTVLLTACSAPLPCLEEQGYPGGELRLTGQVLGGGTPVRLLLGRTTSVQLDVDGHGRFAIGLLEDEVRRANGDYGLMLGAGQIHDTSLTFFAHRNQIDLPALNPWRSNITEKPNADAGVFAWQDVAVARGLSNADYSVEADDNYGTTWRTVTGELSHTFTAEEVEDWGVSRFTVLPRGRSCASGSVITHLFEPAVEFGTVPAHAVPVSRGAGCTADTASRDGGCPLTTGVLHTYLINDYVAYPSWFVIDLGGPRTVRRIMLRALEPAPLGVEIPYLDVALSTDGGAFARAFPALDLRDGVRGCHLDYPTGDRLNCYVDLPLEVPQRARFVRLAVTGVDGGHFDRLDQVSVWE